MTRCEEFSRGEYAPRLLAYFLFLKSLVHEITRENQLNRSRDSKDKEVVNVDCFSSPWLAILLYPARRIFQVPSENGSRTKTTFHWVFPSAKSPGYEESRFSSTEGFAWGGKKCILHDVHVLPSPMQMGIFSERNLLSLFYSFLSVYKKRFVERWIQLIHFQHVISYLYLSRNNISIFCEIINNSCAY